MPDAAEPGPGICSACPGVNLPTGFDIICSLSTRDQRFACAHLPGPHL